MTAQSGRTNSKYISFYLDNSSGTLTDLTPYTKNIGTVGLTFEEQDVTAYSDGVRNVTIGRADAPLSITFQMDTVVYAHLIALNRNTPLSLDIRIGIRHAWESGEPVFGISSSATSGYLLKDLTMNDTDIMASFVVFGSTAPDWATTAHT
jgi:hypothetical protein